MESGLLLILPKILETHIWFLFVWPPVYPSGCALARIEYTLITMNMIYVSEVYYRTLPVESGVCTIDRHDRDVCSIYRHAQKKSFKLSSMGRRGNHCQLILAELFCFENNQTDINYYGVLYNLFSVTIKSIAITINFQVKKSVVLQPMRKCQLQCHIMTWMNVNGTHEILYYFILNEFDVHCWSFLKLCLKLYFKKCW